MTCGNCGKINPEDAVFCEECGEELRDCSESQNALITIILVCIIAAIALMAGIILGNMFLF